jgi:hypothetical protein
MSHGSPRPPGWLAGSFRRRASVGSTEAANEVVARFCVIDRSSQRSRGALLCDRPTHPRGKFGARRALTYGAIDS